ncbi:hypothetical protein D3C71_1697330 [compost metagenome]
MKNVASNLETVVSAIVRSDDLGVNLTLEEIIVIARLYQSLPSYFQKQLYEGLSGFKLQKGLDQIIDYIHHAEKAC